MAAEVVFRFLGYDGKVYGTADPLPIKEPPRDVTGIETHRREIERLWFIEYPDTPFPFEVYGYDW